MQHYVEITLLPNDEIGHYFLWSKIYQQLHLALVTSAAGQPCAVGACFPEYSAGQPRLGRKVRLFAQDAAMLTALKLPEWLSRLSDYSHISSIKPVPAHTQYALVARKQCVTSPERLARRRAKRKGESYEQALSHYSGIKTEASNLPYVDFQSESTQGEREKHRFRLLISQRLVSKPEEGAFSCYGLSKGATVPWF